VRSPRITRSRNTQTKQKTQKETRTRPRTTHHIHHNRPKYTHQSELGHARAEDAHAEGAHEEHGAVDGGGARVEEGAVEGEGLELQRRRDIWNEALLRRGQARGEEGFVLDGEGGGHAGGAPGPAEEHPFYTLLVLLLPVK
jgi:hypothetical protein